MEPLQLHISKLPAKPSCNLSKWLYYRYRLRFQIFRRDKFTCQYCGRTAKDGIQLTLDHIIPQVKGGDWDADNLITSCHVCNRGKDADLLLGFETAALKGEAVLPIGFGSFRLSLEGGTL